MITYTIETYPKNRVVNKIIRALKQNQNFKITKINSEESSRIFEVLFLNDKSVYWFSFVSQICHIIKKEFPQNYQFNFREKKLGYIYCFKITTETGQVINCYSNKKEIRTDGTSKSPELKDQIIL
jgi:hypothetical protein